MSSVKELRKVNIVGVAESLGMALKPKGSGYYEWKEHDSLVINVRKNRFNWFSRELAGDPIALVQAVREDQTGQPVSFKEAKHYVETGSFPTVDTIDYTRKEFSNYLSRYESKDKTLMIDYLKNERGLSEETIRFFDEKGVLGQANYKNAQGIEPVIIFKTLDATGKMIGGSLQGIVENRDLYDRGRLKQMMKHSDGLSCFNVDIGSPKRLIVAEAPIDLMSYYELHKGELNDVRLIAMDGLKGGVLSRYYMEVLHLKRGEVYEVDWKKTPEALSNIAKTSTHFEKEENQSVITLAVDNDSAGRKFLSRLEDKGIRFVSDLPPLPAGKEKSDWNDYLKQEKQEANQSKTKEEDMEVNKNYQAKVDQTVTEADYYVRLHHSMTDPLSQLGDGAISSSQMKTYDEVKQENDVLVKHLEDRIKTGDLAISFDTDVYLYDVFAKLGNSHPFKYLNDKRLEVLTPLQPLLASIDENTVDFYKNKGTLEQDALYQALVPHQRTLGVAISTRFIGELAIAAYSTNKQLESLSTERFGSYYGVRTFDNLSQSIERILEYPLNETGTKDYTYGFVTIPNAFYHFLEEQEGDLVLSRSELNTLLSRLEERPIQILDSIQEDAVAVSEEKEKSPEMTQETISELGQQKKDIQLKDISTLHSEWEQELKDKVTQHLGHTPQWWELERNRDPFIISELDQLFAKRSSLELDAHFADNSEYVRQEIKELDEQILTTIQQEKTPERTQEQAKRKLLAGVTRNPQSPQLKNSEINNITTAAHSIYEDYLVFLTTENEVLLGKSENYNSKGVYDNKDDSLIKVSDNKKMFQLLRDGNMTLSKEEMIDQGYRSVEDYKELETLKTGILSYLLERTPKKVDTALQQSDNSQANKKAPEMDQEQQKNAEGTIGDFPVKQEAAPLPEANNSQPLNDLSPNQTQPQPYLYFTTKEDGKSIDKRFYHVASQKEIAKLNRYALTIQQTAQWYLDKVADSRIIYLYQDGDSISSLAVQFDRDKFMHLTGIFPYQEGQTAEQTLLDFANGKGDFDTILLTDKGATFDKVKVLPELEAIVESDSFYFGDLSEVPKLKRLDLDKAIRSGDEDVLLAMRTVDGTTFPASLMKLRQSLKLQLDSTNQERSVLGVYRYRDNQLDQLSINEELIKDGGESFKSILDQVVENLNQADQTDKTVDEDMVYQDQPLVQNKLEPDKQEEAKPEPVDSTSYTETSNQKKLSELLASKDRAGLTQHLKEGVHQYLNSKQYKDFLNTMSRFPHYSYRNIQLLKAQMPTVQAVASFKSWKEDFGRTVIKGSKSLRIFAPQITKLRDPQTGEILKDGQGNDKTRVTFKLVPVFDISQTEGKELPKPIYQLEGNHENYSKLYRSAKEYAQSKGLTMEFNSNIGEANGYYSRKENKIVIKAGMSEQQTLKTIYHELAHADLHSSQTVTKDLQYSDEELQAESVAYVVANHYGLDTSEYSFGYLATWVKDKEALSDLEAQLEIVQKEAQHLINSLDRELEKQLEQAQAQTVEKVEPVEKLSFEERLARAEQESKLLAEEQGKEEEQTKKQEAKQSIQER